MSSVDQMNDESLIEAFARVVSLDGTVAWLEPEMKSSCGSCTSLSCATSSLSSQIRARRFPLANNNFVVGERVVVGVREGSLLKAALTVYGVPLLMMLGAGITAQWALGRDEMTLLASILGLGLGLGIARLGGNYLSTKDNMAPRFLRRADPSSPQGASCHSH